MEVLCSICRNTQSFEVVEIVRRKLKFDGFCGSRGDFNFRLGQLEVIPEIEVVYENRRTGIAVGVVFYAVFVSHHTRLCLACWIERSEVVACALLPQVPNLQVEDWPHSCDHEPWRNRPSFVRTSEISSSHH